MPLLIDGHNLINALPDIDLDDPHDEAKLVEKLKSYCARKRTKATVVFDGGLPGGQSRDLSNSQVTVIFAASRRTNADRIIRERLRKASNPKTITVISSDHEVIAAAERRRASAVRSEDFVEQLTPAVTLPDDEEDHARDDVAMSADEMAEWLRLFGADEDGDS